MRPKSKSKGKKKKQVEIKQIQMPPIFKKVEYMRKEKKEPLNNNHLLKEIDYQINIYDREVNDSIKKGIKFKDFHFKNNFFKNLKSLKAQVDFIDDINLKSKHIQSLWKYYEDNSKFYYDVSYINSKSIKPDYEKNEEENTSLKSNTYFADNIPLTFEFENRTEDAAILPPKDRLKEYISKHVHLNNLKEEKDNEKVIDKDKETREKEFLKTGGSTLFQKSTQYTQFPQYQNTFYNTNRSQFGNFFIPTKDDYKLDNINNSKEIKSSYGFYKPPHTIDNLIIENKNHIQKNKEVAERRHLHEQREFLDKWGRARSQYKTSVNDKYEILLRINVEKKRIEEEKAKEDLIKYDKSVFNEYDNISDRQENKKIEEDQNNVNEDENENELDNNETKLIDKINLNDAKYVSDSVINQNNNINISINNNLNIDKETILKSFKSNHETKEMPSDALSYLKILNPAFDTRTNFAKFLELKMIDNIKDTYKNSYMPMSAYDNTNIKVFSNFKEMKNKKEIIRPMTGSDILQSNRFNYSNLLSNKELIKEINNNVFNKLRFEQMKNNKKILENNEFADKFLAPDEGKVIKSKYFLPLYEQLLINKPEENIKKKRPKSKIK